MLALIASYDGENAILMFHVEQKISAQRDIEYRLRRPESAYAALQDWGDPRTSSRVPVKVAVVDPAAAIEAQWRFKGEQGWEDCVPMEIDPSVGRFEVHILQDRSESDDLEIDAMAMVGDHTSVYAVKLPYRPTGYKAGEVVEAYGVSQGVSPGQFFKRGEFVARSKRLAVIGQESQVTLRIVEKAVPKKADHHKRAVLIITGKKLSEAEMSLFLKEKEVANG